MISAKQIRAARGMLDWPQKTLADKSGLSPATLRLIEKDDKNITDVSANKIRQAFEKAGLEFFENNGVSYRKNSADIYHGAEAHDMLHELFLSARSNGDPIHMMCKSWLILEQVLGLADSANLKRFELISQNVTVNCLLADSANAHEHALSFNFKALPSLFMGTVTHCVVKNKYIIAQQNDGGSFTYVVLKSAQSFFQEFLPLWKQAVPLLPARNDASQKHGIVTV